MVEYSLVELPGAWCMVDVSVIPGKPRKPLVGGPLARGLRVFPGNEAAFHQPGLGWCGIKCFPCFRETYRPLPQPPAAPGLIISEARN